MVRKSKECCRGRKLCNGTKRIRCSRKKKYARIFLLGNPTINGDLEGDECATTASFQVDSFAAGFKSLSAVYDIDNASHEAMIAMGFRRTYGPEEQNNIDNSIKRIVSRYSRVYMGELEM